MSSPDMFASTPNSQDIGLVLTPSFTASQSLTPPTPTPDLTPPTPSSTPLLNPELDSKSRVVFHMMKIDFFDSEGVLIKSQSCSDGEIISIVSSIVRSSSFEHKKSAVAKVCESESFKDLVEEKVMQNLSHQFESFISNPDCPLKIRDFLDCPELLAGINFDDVLNKCYEECPGVVNALSTICLGTKDYWHSIAESNKKHQKKRLLAVIAIGAFTRNQKGKLSKHK